MGIIRDLIDQRFGKLVVLGRSDNNKHERTTWKCICDCGNIKVIDGCSLTTGNTTSCGCYARELLRSKSFLHGLTGTKTHNAWKQMQARCCNPNYPDYSYYGGRGISISPRWLESFNNFLADMGIAPTGKSLDRIDVNGNYELSNCRWATWKQQANNRRNNRYIEYDGINLTVSQWAEKIGITSASLATRLNALGWSIEEALTIPSEGRRANSKKYQRFIEYNGVNLPLCEWSEKTGFSPGLICDRIDKLGWTVEKALTTPRRVNK